MSNGTFVDMPYSRCMKRAYAKCGEADVKTNADDVGAGTCWNQANCNSNMFNS